MKFFKEKNLFQVIYEGKEGYVIIDKTEITNIKDHYGKYHLEKSKIIIASTFPLGDLPQFVIKTIIPNSEYKEGMFGYTDTEVRVAQNAFKEGWDKHAEKYNFTKEDVIKAITLAREISGMEAVIKQLKNEYLTREDFQYTEEEIIQSLQKRKEIIEIEFETEEYAVGNYGLSKGEPTIDIRLKITKSIKYPNGLLTIKNINYA